MNQHEKLDKTRYQDPNKLSASVSDIDQLCNLIDESSFGLRTFSATKHRSVSPLEVKAFRSTRLKRLHASSLKKSNRIVNKNVSLLRSMHLSLSSSLLEKFRSLSTYSQPPTRRSSSPTITMIRTKSILPSIREEEMNSSAKKQSHLSCTVVDTCRTTANSCNVEELAAYFDNFLYLPKSLSGAAELMYT